ncbi:MAG: hypothetical protein A3F18_03570 [Legionellales bacterium RIFCSPHIGHO2_12_FULL_37_14]|nr:MAG: hypothetical protein A3F18_03570 [Legionellales bacterium RIFCSPHIGHO2_12_FULL_37_14]
MLEEKANVAAEDKSKNLKFRRISLEEARENDSPYQCEYLIVTDDEGNIEKIEFCSISFPKSPIWTATSVSFPEIMNISSSQWWALNMQEVADSILAILEVDPNEVGVIKFATPERNNELRKIKLLDGDLGTLIEGSCDSFGRLQGFAIIEDLANFKDIKVRVEGNFINHHLVTGKIFYTYASGINHEYIIDTPLTSKDRANGTLTIRNPKISSEEVTYTMELIRHGHHLFGAFPEEVVEAKVSWKNIPADSEVKKRSYEGGTKRLNYHGQGKEEIVKVTPNSSITQVHSGIYNEGTLEKDGKISLNIEYTDGSTSKMILNFPICKDPTNYHASSLKIMLRGDTEIRDYKSGIFNKDCIVQGERTRTQLKNGRPFLRIENYGKFNLDEELHSTRRDEACEANLFVNDNLFEKRRGIFVNGDLIMGCKISYCMDGGGRKEQYGVFTNVKEPRLGDLNSNRLINKCLFHDPRGVCINFPPGREGKDAVWTMGYAEDSTTNPEYFLYFAGAAGNFQLKAIALPHKWRVSRNQMAGFEFECLEAQAKKSAKDIRAQAIIQFNLIEDSLICLKVLIPFQTLADLSKQEAREKVLSRVNKANGKKLNAMEDAEKDSRNKIKNLEKAQMQELTKLFAKSQKDLRRTLQQQHLASLNAKRKQSFEEYLGKQEATSMPRPLSPSSANQDETMTGEDITPNNQAAHTVQSSSEDTGASAELVFNPEMLLDPKNSFLFFNAGSSGSEHLQLNISLGQDEVLPGAKLT